MKILRTIQSYLAKPVPYGVLLCMLFGLPVLGAAAVPLVTASLAVPATGSITANQLTALSCVGTNASKVFVSGTNCVTSIPNPLPIASGGTNASSFTNPSCIRYNGTALASANSDCIPIYNHSGVAITPHAVLDTTTINTTCPANTICSGSTGVTFTGNAVFSSASSYVCFYSPSLANPVVDTQNSQTATSPAYQVANPQGGSIGGVGTPLTYFCIGT